MTTTFEYSDKLSVFAKNSYCLLEQFINTELVHVNFKWDNKCCGWVTTNKTFVNTYSSELMTYNMEAENKLKYKFMQKHFPAKLILYSFTDKIILQLD